MFNFPITIIANSSTYSSRILSFNPFFYWRLEETTGTTMADTSINNRPSTISGTYTLNQTGSLNDTSVSVATNSTLIRQNTAITLPSSNYTIICRFKTSALNAGICIFADNPSSPSSYSPSLYLIGGKVEIYYFNGSGAYLTSTLTYNDNIWHTLAASIGTAGTKLYIDGNLVASNGNTAAASFGGTWGFGRTTTLRGAITPILGNLDEIAYFNTQLTDANILLIHQSV